MGVISICFEEVVEFDPGVILWVAGFKRSQITMVKNFQIRLVNNCLEGHLDPLFKSKVGFGMMIEANFAKEEEVQNCS